MTPEEQIEVMEEMISALLQQNREMKAFVDSLISSSQEARRLNSHNNLLLMTTCKHMLQQLQNGDVGIVMECLALMIEYQKSKLAKE
jgi:hypothetical protein